MWRNRFMFEYDGALDPDYCWRDNLYYLLSLQVKDVLTFHQGCVNTIVWDEPGECILSGSDDRRIAITRLFNSFSNQPTEVVFSQKLPADSNIFSAKFLPHTSNGQIVVGFKCGCVLFVQPEAPPESRVQVVHCHSYATYDVLPMPDLPHCFLTISHDQSVMCFDTRIPFGYRSNQQACNQRCTYPGYQPMTTESTGLYRLKFQFPVTAGDVHPLDGSRRIALASADGFVRLFDLRKLTISQFSSAAQGESVEPLPFQVTRPLGLPAQLDERSAIRLNCGPTHITSVQFEPIYMGSAGQRGLPEITKRPMHPAGAGGKRLLVSHMYAPVFLFDLDQNELPDAASQQTVDWLPDPSEEQSEESTTAAPVTAGATYWMIRHGINDPEIRRSLILFRSLERLRILRQSAPPAAPEGDASSDEEQPAEPRVSQTRTTAPPTQPALSPQELLTEEYVAKVLSSAPRARQIMSYRGRQSCRTVIKAAVFWGRDYILSGSECGHMIIWNRWSGAPVSMIKADRSVVNRIAPHPRLPIIACSGIDRSVKIIEPQPSLFEENLEPDQSFSSIVKTYQEQASTLCDTNANQMRASLSSGASFLEGLTRIRTAHVIRNILRRIAMSIRSSESTNPDDNSTESSS